jgi:hypothetical protein
MKDRCDGGAQTDVERGDVKIENRAALEDAACECYGQLIQQIKSWHSNQYTLSLSSPGYRRNSTTCGMHSSDSLDTQCSYSDWTHTG